ncbi:host-specific AK-toxin Akt2 [Fusarium pseudoanthophilum]|uniref:Host-specific AK-toxin Akt2 n=1 Tax=Fusarium pseudoanthophilum TaxID=48495 RepID=A0A8H5UU37_9HYPO|nr:host-specific AK-toxin Akt2 [Fusarium pseudoanthophilum]
MSITLLKKYLPISLALLLFYGSASRFSHGATSTASFYQYQNDRSPVDGSTLSRVIPVFDIIVGTAILQQGLSRKVATCFVASTITSVAVQRYLAGLDCQGDFLQGIWATAAAIATLHSREYLAETANGDEDTPKLAVKQYVPHDNPNPQPGDVTIIGAHANGFPKELYEPLWDELYDRARQQDVRIRSIWIADVWNQGQSGVLNEKVLGNDLSWFDHARDLMNLINQHQRDIPHPIVGIGHSMGGTQLAQMALWHPRLLDSLVLIDPIIQIPNPSISLAGLSTKRRDIWSSREDAVTRFKKSKFFQSWDPRVLDLWIEHGLRNIPTELHPEEEGSSPDERVTLTTSKHQELFSFVRPTYLPRDWESFNDQDPEQNKDCPDYPFHRPEPPKIFRQLPELRPSTLFVFGKQSEFSSPKRREEKMLTTGTGIGGSGGAAAGRVQEESLNCGHLIPMENVSECADVISSFLGKEMKRWRDQRESFKRYRGIMSRRQRITIDEQWEDKVKLGDQYLRKP